MNLQFPIDIPDVRTHRFDADEQRIGDLLIAAAGCQDVKDLLSRVKYLDQFNG